MPFNATIRTYPSIHPDGKPFDRVVIFSAACGGKTTLARKIGEFYFDKGVDCVVIDIDLGSTTIRQPYPAVVVQTIQTVREAIDYAYLIQSNLPPLPYEDEIEYAVKFHFEPDYNMGPCVKFVKSTSPSAARAKFLASAIPEMKIDSILPRKHPTIAAKE
jgi:hypothetical protein